MYETLEHWKQYKQEQNELQQAKQLFEECGFQYKAKAKLEMYKTYKKEKQIKHNHEKFASISAIVFFGIIAIIINCLV